jgi:hypothetical protein
MARVELRIGLRVIGAAMHPAGLGAGKRAARDCAGERVRILEQALKALGASTQPRELPQSGLRGAIHREARCREGLRLRAPASRLCDRRAGGAGAPDEALAERVGGEAVGAVQAGAG